MTDLFIRRRDIASCPWTKQSHSGKCIHWKLRTSTLASDGSLTSTANFVPALSMLIMLKYTTCSLFCNVVVFLHLVLPENHLQKVARLWKHTWGRFLFDNLIKSLVEVSFPFHLQLCKNILEWLLYYEVTVCNL